MDAEGLADRRGCWPQLGAAESLRIEAAAGPQAAAAGLGQQLQDTMEQRVTAALQAASTLSPPPPSAERPAQPAAAATSDYYSRIRTMIQSVTLETERELTEHAAWPPPLGAADAVAALPEGALPSTQRMNDVAMMPPSCWPVGEGAAAASPTVIARPPGNTSNHHLGGAAFRPAHTAHAAELTCRALCVAPARAGDPLPAPTASTPAGSAPEWSVRGAAAELALEVSRRVACVANGTSLVPPAKPKKPPRKKKSSSPPPDKRPVSAPSRAALPGLRDPRSVARAVCCSLGRDFSTGDGFGLD
eukprot:COSAG01_NODE_1324_length_10724_cov_27.870776_4_plen_303_part_00